MNPFDFLFTTLAFLLAIAILITVHELGHFWCARLLGVKVLRFSLGFGPSIFKWQRAPDTTEYVLAAIPFGGYIKMLDEQEGEVPADQLNQAFNRQPIWKRSLIVLAGPLSNLLFAITVYWIILMLGDPGLRPRVGAVEPASIAEQSGFKINDELLMINQRRAGNWEQALFALTIESLSGKDVLIQVRAADGQLYIRKIPSDALVNSTETPDLIKKIGIEPQHPKLPPIIGELVAGEPAQQAGLQLGDRLLTADGTALDSWDAWVAWVRNRPAQPIQITVERSGQILPAMTLTPRAVETDGHQTGRIGAGVQISSQLLAEYQVQIRYNPWEAFEQACSKTFNLSTLMLRVVGRMLIGTASVHNLSGPLTIAETAGRTASNGPGAFMKFLAVVSISLGVLNLLPIPVLDGGYLLFFLLEWMRGRPLSERFLSYGQQIGLVLLIGLMMLAFYLDFMRFLS